jgi:hypothetical protein
MDPEVLILPPKDYYKKRSKKMSLLLMDQIVFLLANCHSDIFKKDLDEIKKVLEKLDFLAAMGSATRDKCIKNYAGYRVLLKHVRLMRQKITPIGEDLGW